MNAGEIRKTEDELEMGGYTKRGTVLVSGRAEFAYDADGREYIDCVAGHGVCVLGHAHPKVAQAVREQGERMLTCSETYYNDRRAELLALLQKILPRGLKRIFLCNSGTESVEAALKLARATTKKKGFVAAMNGFHGRSMGALSLTYRPQYREPFLPLVGPVTHVHYNNAGEIEKILKENKDIAAVVLECVQGEGGVRPATREYLRAVREACSANDVLLILDEVQTGWGRTGKMFACENFGVAPDVMCVAKGMANGVPTGAAISRDDLRFQPQQHGSTFGGNPLACAAAVATINVLIDEKIPEKAARGGEKFLAGLKEFENGKGDVREARGMGLMLALELKKSSKEYIMKCAEKGVLAMPAGDMVLRLLPPLIISENSVARVLSVLDEVIG
ncbi:MAG: acetylornithine/succinylornithine family transaminase [Candidatus Micrarchaeota archaeon]